MARAQQDPDDSGTQDSVIVSSAMIDSGASTIQLPVYFRADDTVAFFHVPLHLDTPGGGIAFDTFIVNEVSPCWETVFEIEQDHLHLLGWDWSDTISCPYPLPHQSRLLVGALVLSIEPNAPGQIAIIDTAWDERHGSIHFGPPDGITEITPAVLRGLIYYNALEAGEPDLIQPGPIHLNQNYPNPFNARTIISYSLPQAGPVELAIYNIAGQRVATLFKGAQAAGEHQAVWDAGSTPSGLYFYRIAIGDSFENKRMILLR